MSQDVNLKKSKLDQGAVIKNEIAKYLRYWYWFLIGLFLAVIGAFIYLRYTPKIFNSSAKIKILNKTKGLELPSSAFVFNRSNINLENEIEIIKSYRIIEKVVEKINLTTRFYEDGSVLTTEINRLPFDFIKTLSNDSIVDYYSYRIEIDKQGFSVYNNRSDSKKDIVNYNSYIVEHDFPFEIQFQNPDLAKPYIGRTFQVRFIPVSAATKQLKGQIAVSTLGKGSDLLKLSHSSQSRGKSVRILNTLIEVFNQDGINDRQEISRRTIEFIDERFKSLALELDSIEVDIKDFKKSNSFINIESDAEINLTQKTATDSEVFNLENQLMLSDLLFDTINQDDSKSNLLPANVGLDNSNVNNLISQYNDIVFERDKLMVSGGENNPQVKVVNEKLKNVERNIIESLNAYKTQLEASKIQLEKRNQKFTNQVGSLPLKEKLLRSRIRQQEIKQTLYLFLLQKREEAAINLAITEPSIKVVEYALSDGSPISPNSRNIYLIAMFFGLVIPFGFIYGLNLLNTKIKGKDDVVNTVGKIPILAELPIIKKGNLVFNNPLDRTVQSEAFRILSANVDYILPQNQKGKDDGKVIYCTSTIKGEGKTYVALNLSLALSSLNKKVLLIGADLRNPQIHNYVSKNKSEQGLANFLHQTPSFDWKSCLIKGFEKHPNHEILLSGSIPPNPTQLLTNGRFSELLDEAKRIYEYVIVDTAPTILVTDTLLISKLADATIYLVRADYTEKNLLEFSKELNHSGKLKNMAYVLNGVDKNSSYGYGYNYGYNYGYGNRG